MAVFMVNGCKFRNCSLIFETLAELIQHIEESHIQDAEREDDDRPQAIAMSRVLRFYGGAKPKKSLLAIATSPVITKKSRQRTNSIMLTSASIRSLTPTSSEYDFEDEDNGGESYGPGGGLDSLTDLESSAEQQWTNQLILKMISNKTDADEEKEKSFVCPIPGCRKRYKNIGGAKLHIKNSHKRETRIAKSISKCFCGKSFQTAKQLEQHAESEHSLSTLGIIQSGEYSTPLTSASSSDPKLSITIKDEPTSSQRADTSKGHPLSIIHPITISGGVLLTPATARHFKNVNKGDILVAHRIATSSSAGGQNKQMVASLIATSSSSLVTPPTTPHRTTSNLSLTTSIKPRTPTLSQKLEEQQQKALNEKVAQVLTAAKHAMQADAASKTTATTIIHQPTIVTLNH